MLKFEGDEDRENKGMLLWFSTSALQDLALKNYELNCCSWCCLCECKDIIKYKRFSLIGGKFQCEAFPMVVELECMERNWRRWIERMKIEFSMSDFWWFIEWLLNLDIEDSDEFI